MKTFWIVFGVSFLTFWIGVKSAPFFWGIENPSAQSVSNKKFQSILDKDYEEYISLKGQKEKYEKADELLGKMILVFLADLGLRATETSQHYAAEASNGIHKFEEVAPTDNNNIPKEEPEKEDDKPKPESEDELETSSIPSSPTDDLAEEKISETTLATGSKLTYTSAVKRTFERIENQCFPSLSIDFILSNSQLFSDHNPNTRKLNGDFYGKIYPKNLNSDSDILKISTTINFKRERGMLSGEIDFQLINVDSKKNIFDYIQKGENEVLKRQVKGEDNQRMVYFDFSSAYVFALCSFSTTRILGTAFDSNNNFIGYVDLRKRLADKS